MAEIMSVFSSHETSLGFAFQIAENRSVLANFPDCKCAIFFVDPFRLTLQKWRDKFTFLIGSNTIRRCDKNLLTECLGESIG